MRVQLVSTGMATPAHVETAEDLAPRLGTWSARDIIRKTGVARRHVATTETVEQLAAEAGNQALAAATQAGRPGKPDLLINASLTPVQLLPDTSVYHLEALGLKGIPSFSVQASCMSFLVAMHTAGALIHAGAYRRVLIVSSEIGTGSRNFEEPESAALIGDGAGAAVLEAAPEGSPSRLLAWDMGTWPSAAQHTEIRGCGLRHPPFDPATTPEDYLFHMNGRAIYRFAVKRVHAMLERLFAEASRQSEAAGGPPITRADVDLVVPHQASGNALYAITRMGIPKDRIVDIVGEYGNCIAASLPMALHTASSEGRLKRGDLVLLMGTGAGLSVAGALLRW